MSPPPHWFPPLLASVLAGGPVVLSGCTTCDERDGTLSMTLSTARDARSSTKIEYLEAGGFTLEGVTYDSCADFCERQGLFLDLSDCGAPPPQPGSSRTELSCTGTFAVCSSPRLMGSGRLTRGLREPPQPTTRDSYLKAMLYGERAAIVAFRRLYSELLHYGATGELLEGCLRARADEVRHARRLCPLVEGKTATPRVRAQQLVRPLDEILYENVIEGCIEETVGALVLGVQAARAEDAAVREIAKEFTGDEAEHADLSFRIMLHYLRDANTRLVARGALARGLRSLALGGARPRMPAQLRVRLGLPSAAELGRIVDRVAMELLVPLARATA